MKDSIHKKTHEIKIYIILIILVIPILVFATCHDAAGQSDPIGKLLEEGLQGIPGQTKTPPAVPDARGAAAGKVPACAEGWECVFAGRIVKSDYGKANAELDIGRLTGDRGYDRISLRQTIRETHGVIVNTIKVGAPGRWKSYSQGLRLPAGRTMFSIPVPVGTPKVVLSLDHGRGARVRVVLERRLP